MISIFEPTAEQLCALGENERLQIESRTIEYLIEHSQGSVSELLSHLRSNVEQIKALNARELCANLAHRK
jgi:hypothetical protein